jgi:hypothetical protein
MSLPKFNLKHLQDLAGVLLRTQPVELTCDELLSKIAPFAEAILKSGMAPEDSALIQQHLDICPECQEEFEALLAALRERKV